MRQFSIMSLLLHLLRGRVSDLTLFAKILSISSWDNVLHSAESLFGGELSRFTLFLTDMSPYRSNPGRLSLLDMKRQVMRSNGRSFREPLRMSSFTSSRANSQRSELSH